MCISWVARWEYLDGLTSQNLVSPSWDPGDSKASGANHMLGHDHSPIIQFHHHQPPPTTTTLPLHTREDLLGSHRGSLLLLLLYGDYLAFEEERVEFIVVHQAVT